MSKLEYIASGLSYTRLCTNGFIHDPVLVDCAKRAISELQNKDGIHTLGALWNAYAEVKYGDYIYNNELEKVFSSIHADSGGLQIVTTGSEITEELKQEIYLRQSNQSDIGMCFDEIPVITEGKSARASMNGRYFDSDNVADYGFRTGKNLNDQINSFKSNPNNISKPMLIVHGNTIENFVEFFNNALLAVEPDNVKYIAGIAVSAASIGNGVKESIETLRALGKINIPDDMGKHLHFLGYGALARLLPVIMLIKSGYLSRFTISYDSTTHTSAYFMKGAYFDDIRGKYIDYGKIRNKNSEYITTRIYTRFSHIFQEVFDCDYDEYMDLVNADLITSDKFNSDNKRNNQICELKAFLNAIVSIDNFLNTVTDVWNGKYGQVDKRDECMLHLINVKDSKDFDRWYKSFGRALKSKAIKEITTQNSLEAFFV